MYVSPYKTFSIFNIKRNLDIRWQSRRILSTRMWSLTKKRANFGLSPLSYLGEASETEWRPSLKAVFMRFFAASCRLCLLLSTNPHTEDYCDQPSHLKLLIRKTCECLLVCNLMTCCYRFSCRKKWGEWLVVKHMSSVNSQKVQVRWASVCCNFSLDNISFAS